MSFALVFSIKHSKISCTEDNRVDRKRFVFLI